MNGDTRRRIGILKAGTAGLVTTTAPAPPHPGNLCHTMPTRLIAGPRTAIIRKIMAYNNTGANVPLLFGTRDRNPAGAAFVQLLPAFVALDTFDNEWVELEIPAVEWQSNETPTAAGRDGNIYVVAGTVAIPVAGVIVQVEIEEFGETGGV
jgi:hypothetical protein